MSRSSALAIGLGALAAALVSCGAEDHKNELRPPSPIAIAATVNEQEILLSENEVGAGLADLTVSNQSPSEVELTFAGPTEAARSAPEDSPPGRQAVSVAVAPGSTGALRVNLEPGTYEVSAGPASSAAATALLVGPERRSAQNDLLLP